MHTLPTLLSPRALNTAALHIFDNHSCPFIYQLHLHFGPLFWHFFGFIGLPVHLARALFRHLALFERSCEHTRGENLFILMCGGEFMRPLHYV